MKDLLYKTSTAGQSVVAETCCRREHRAGAAPAKDLSHLGVGPKELDPQIARQIRCKAGQLLGKEGFARQDRADLEQELTEKLLSRLAGFDARRASRRTFVSRLLDSCAASMLKARRATKRPWRRDVRSLSEIVENEEGEPIELLQLLEEASGLFVGGGGAAPDRLHALALRIDMERVLATLGEKEREACEMLARYAPYQAARRMGLAQATFYDLLGRVRAVFTAAGLKIYL